MQATRQQTTFSPSMATCVSQWRTLELTSTSFSLSIGIRVLPKRIGAFTPHPLSVESHCKSSNQHKQALVATKHSNAADQLLRITQWHGRGNAKCVRIDRCNQLAVDLMQSCKNKCTIDSRENCDG
mmetsp:Transcript_80926/g.160395  ORF Transcript_80926/g.160395 Transcript_80926/m.160395 type:complete len:126 (-) Transcript_80926:64-441(-)